MKLGLTGGIGCGKSTASRMFGELGWNVVGTDAIVRDLLASDPEVVAALRERWGDAVFGADGSVDRKAVGARVFADGAELVWLEALLHPRVREAWTSLIAKAPQALWLVEIPLLFEKNLESRFDFTVCLECPDAIVRDRMVARGFSGADLEVRRARQLPIEEKVRRADFVISNAGNLDFLERQVAALHRRLVHPTQPNTV